MTRLGRYKKLLAALAVFLGPANDREVPADG